MLFYIGHGRKVKSFEITKDRWKAHLSRYLEMNNYING
jgi:hypothetical protein